MRKLLKIGVPNMRYSRLSLLTVTKAQSARSFASSRFTLGESEASSSASFLAFAESLFATWNEEDRCCSSPRAGLVHATDLLGNRQTDFIYHPGALSLITALLAGAAGTLSLTAGRSAVLVGVFISVTTVPAAGNVAVASVLGLYHQALGSLTQLAVNLVGIVVAAYLVLLAQARWTRRRRVGVPSPE